MSYYSRNSSDGYYFVVYAALFVFAILIMMGTNSCSAEKWNEWICPDCNVRYELRGASRGLKYYACPECGQEVDRY